MDKSPKIQTISNNLYIRCITILISMRRNLIEYKNAFNIKYPGILCFDLNEDIGTDNEKRVIICFDIDTNKYNITTLFDGIGNTNEIIPENLPISTLMTLFELFKDVRSFWCAFEKFNEQQQYILEKIPVHFIIPRLTKYVKNHEATIYSDGNSYMLSPDINIQEFLGTNNISYLDVYRSVFFNINDY